VVAMRRVKADGRLVDGEKRPPLVIDGSVVAVFLLFTKNSQNHHLIAMSYVFIVHKTYITDYFIFDIVYVSLAFFYYVTKKSYTRERCCFDKI
jgi:hypothetical protein